MVTFKDTRDLRHSQLEQEHQFFLLHHLKDLAHNLLLAVEQKWPPDKYPNNEHTPIGNATEELREFFNKFELEEG